MSAFIMRRVAGHPVVAAHPALYEAGARLRRLHEVMLPGFGFLAEAAWHERDDFSLKHSDWLGFLRGICADALSLADRHAVAVRLAASTAAAIDAHAAALDAIEVGSLCHGDLKAAHILIEADRLAGVIDWGDAMVGDPLWDVARFAHRADADSLSSLLAGYDPEHAMVDELTWRMPLYHVLWLLVDAIVDHRLGGRADTALAAAMRALERV
jgi:aminoglycoside phosphotransferase (APT) family kinase protein